MGTVPREQSGILCAETLLETGDILDEIHIHVDRRPCIEEDLSRTVTRYPFEEKSDIRSLVQVHVPCGTDQHLHVLYGGVDLAVFGDHHG